MRLKLRQPLRRRVICSCMPHLFCLALVQLLNSKPDVVGGHDVRRSTSLNALLLRNGVYNPGNVDKSSWRGKPERHAKTTGLVDDCAHGISSQPVGVSAIFDPTCSPNSSLGGARFGGYNCAGGRNTTHGGSCRLCYQSQQAALAADMTVVSPKTKASAPAAHVIMCNTGAPPPASECSDGCQASDEAVRPAFSTQANPVAA